MTLSHDHHVVPQFYLRAFADGQRKIQQLSRDDRVGRLVAVKRATVAADFYNIRDADGFEHDGWEKILSRLEAHAAPAIRAVVGGRWPLVNAERERMVSWIAAQYLRTPAFRFVLDRTLDDFREDTERGGVAAILKAVNRPDLSDEEALSLWKKGNEAYPRGAYQSSNTQLRWFGDLLPGLAKALYERAWTVVRFSTPALLTADNAVVPIDDRGDLHPLAGGARVVSIALDRRTLLMLVDTKPHYDREVVGTPEVAFMANAVAVHNADRWVFQHPSDDHAAPLWDIPA